MATWIAYKIVDDDETRTTYLNLDRVHHIAHIEYDDPEDSEINIVFDMSSTNVIVFLKRSNPEVYERVLAYLESQIRVSPEPEQESVDE